MSISTTIAEAVVSEITEAADDLSKEFTAEYVLSPEFDAEKETGIKVFVVTLTESIDLNGTRAGSSDDTYNVRIAIWCNLSPENRNAEANEMIQFVDEVKALLIAKYRLSAFPDAALVKMERLRYDPAQFENYIFGSVITCDYRHLV